MHFEFEMGSDNPPSSYPKYVRAIAKAADGFTLSPGEKGRCKWIALTAFNFRMIYQKIKKYDHSPLLDSLTEGQLQRIRARRSCLLIDFSFESYPSRTDTYDGLYDKIKELNLPAGHIFLINGNLASDAYNQQYCADRQLEPVNMIGYDSLLFIYKSWLQDAPDTTAMQSFLNDKIKGAYESSNSFLCLNRMPRPHRWATMLYLAQHHMMQDGLVSFAGPALPIKQPAFSSKHCSHDMFSSEVATILGGLVEVGLASQFGADIEYEISQILSQCPIEIDNGFSRPVLEVAFASDNHLYKDTNFSIVTDTRFVEPDTLFLTEKIYKPMVYLHPFVYLGSCGALRHIQKLGFKTFHSIIDESYDEECEPAKRFRLALEQARALSQAGPVGWRKIMQKLRPVFLHNRELLISKNTYHSQALESRLLSKLKHGHEFT